MHLIDLHVLRQRLDARSGNIFSLRKIHKINIWSKSMENKPKAMETKSNKNKNYHMLNFRLASFQETKNQQMGPEGHFRIMPTQKVT